MHQLVYLYFIFVHNRCNFHHREIERKYLVRNFAIFLRRKKPSTFYFQHCQPNDNSEFVTPKARCVSLLSSQKESGLAIILRVVN